MALGFGLVACTASDASFEPRGAMPPIVQRLPIQGVPAPLREAHCEVEVEGIGVVDMENDYLPHVIQCENGGANLEALKAQAIAARSVAYYAIETSGGICDSQGCQVYSCGADPGPIHYQAVAETSGMYMLYDGTLTYGFYVAGDSDVMPPACIGEPDPPTEKWVTYNEGKTGAEVEQTALGFIHDPGDAGYGQNRGCMSQWGARCLENENGYDDLGILRFFYGDDIMVVQAEGECVTEAGSTTATPGDTTSTGASSSGGGPTSDDLPGSGTLGGGTGGAGDDLGGEALPDTFGGGGAGAPGCGCRGGGPSRPWVGLWGLWILATSRRRPAAA